MIESWLVGFDLLACVCLCWLVLWVVGCWVRGRCVRMNVLLVGTRAHTRTHTQVRAAACGYKTLVVNLSALLYRLLHSCSVGIPVVGFDVFDDSSSSSSSSSGDVFSRYTRSSSRGRR